MRLSGFRRDKMTSLGRYGRRAWSFFVLVSVGFVSASCGMKGDLYLPDDQPAKNFSEVSAGTKSMHSAVSPQ